VKSIVVVDQLSFRYDLRTEVNAIHNLSFTVKQGEWLAVIGHNGSGKSTLAQLLVGLLTPQIGKIHISNMEMNESSKWEIRKKVGLVFQNPDHQFIGTTVQDDVAFGLENINMSYSKMKPRVDEALEMVGMTEFRLYDPSRLSGGQKQRVAIAGILALQPDVLILDEAFVMLDPRSRRELMKTLYHLQNAGNLTIISITHDMNEAAAANRMIMMKDGEIVHDDTPQTVFDAEQSLVPPFAEQLRRKLDSHGKNVPQTYMSDDEMVNWICKSISKT